MLKQLKTGLKQLDIVEKHLDQLSSELIAELPEDKGREASKLLAKAKKGKANVSEFMAFAGNMRKKDKDDLKKNVERFNEKAEEVKDK